MCIHTLYCALSRLADALRPLLTLMRKLNQENLSSGNLMLLLHQDV